MLTWSQEERELRVMAVSSRTLKNTGEKLCAVLDPGSLWAGEVESFTFCPLRRFAPPRGARGSLWKLVYVGDRPRGDVWERLPPPADGLRAYRFRWTGEGRPCLDSLPEPGAPFLTDRLQPLALEPPCEEPVGPLLLDAVQSLSVGH